jgi:hypothetical protein
MFVYRKGKLIEGGQYISPTEQIYRLTHSSSGMVIEVKFDPSSQGSYGTNTNPYKVYKEVNGMYTIYKEFYAKNKSMKENFEDAILFFEDNIYKALNEKPPQQTQPPADPPKPPKEVDVPPEVGDIVKVNGEYGIVTDVYGTKVITRKLTKEEATRILQDRKNASISIEVADTNAPTFKKGGITPKVAKPIVGDVIKVNGKYGVVTDVLKNKVEVKNISKTDALRILKTKTK